MHSTSALRASVTILVLCVLCALLVRDAAVPPAPLPASAPPTEFSAERALAHVREIAQRPHPAGSADNARVRDYVIAQLRALGLEPQVQEATGVGTRYPESGFVRNVLARIPGRTPGGPAVVLMAHYDGVPGGPAAGDDAAGTAAILETVRALRAGPPLAHDVMIVITDGEEAGLLGAAAFVREHPWAKDVGVTLNFEARGTTGRSYMFETGPGNLDVVRVLRRAGDVSATSLSVTVYRTLPNDTDLSEMAVLGKPALNFAFADGVERYHTAHDDVAHLNPGSLQHHGSQMLTMARAFGDGPLPRPITGDAVFFDVPFLGLIVYPESWARPLAIVALLLTLAALVRLARVRPRWGRELLLGVFLTVLTTGVAAGATFLAGNLIERTHDAMGWGGAAAFRGVYASALALLALSVALAGWTLVRRRASVAGALVGALVVWSALTVVVTLKVPGVSFVFAWPLLAGAVAALTIRLMPTDPVARLTPGTGTDVAIWAATIVGTVIVVPLIYAIAAVLLGIVGPGGIATGMFVALLAFLLGPQLEAMGGRRWTAAISALVASVALVCVGMVTVRSSPDHPTGSIVVYALDADSSDAWVAVRGLSRRQVPQGLRGERTPPAWLARLVGRGATAAFAPVQHVEVSAPTASVMSDSTVGDERRLAIRIVPASGTEVINLQAPGVRVLRASIDGRAIDTSRYRGGVRSWRLDYNGPPPSGIALGMVVPAGQPLTLDIMTRTPGLPSFSGLQLPARTPDIVTVQTGDITLVHRIVRY